VKLKALLFGSVAFCALQNSDAFAQQSALSVPETQILTSPNNSPLSTSQLVVIPTNGSPKKLGDALASGAFPGFGTTAGTAAAGNLAVQNVNLVCDNSTFNDAALSAAIATGSKQISVSAVGSLACRVSQTIALQSGQTISGVGGQPTLALVSGSVGRMFDLTGLNNVTIQNLNLDGTNAPAGSDFVRFYNTTSSRFLYNTVNAPSAQSNACVLLAQTSTDNEVGHNTFINCGGPDLIGNNAGVSRNKIHHNTSAGGVSFGFRLSNGANHNEISFNKFQNSGIEPIAISLGANNNQIIGNDVGLSGDNCISIVGDHNLIEGNHGTKCAKAGTYLWGSQNTVTGNSFLDNNTSVAGWPCIGASANYGGTGQYNSVKGNTCDDDQASPTQLGVVANVTPPTVWSAGLTVTAGQFLYYGLNNYAAGSAGMTGSTPPTCMSGSCSDGTISWTYQSTFITQAGAFFNQMWDNNVIRYAGTGPFSGVTPSVDQPLDRNGDFLLSQVYQEATTSTAIGSGGFIVDGWRFNASVSNQFVFSRATAISLPGSYYALTATSQTAFTLSSSSFFQIMDRIESTEIDKLQWGTANALPVTLDACLNTTGITGPVAFTIDSGSGAATVYVSALNVTSAGVWQCFSQTIPGATTGSWSSTPGSIAVRLAFGLSAGSAEVSSVYGWQTGSYAGPSNMAQFTAAAGNVLRVSNVCLHLAGTQCVHRSYAQELQLAGRWFYSSFLAHGQAASNQGIAGALCTVNPVAGGYPSIFIKTPTQMFGVAANEIVSTFNPSASNANWRDVTAGTDVAASVDPASAKGPSGVLLTTSVPVAAAGDVLCIHTTLDSGL
jgi:hypothetical protein